LDTLFNTTGGGIGLSIMRIGMSSTGDHLQWCGRREGGRRTRRQDLHRLDLDGPRQLQRQQQLAAGVTRDSSS
jgi:hypothetical protein